MRKVLVFTLFLLLFAGTANATWMYWYTQDAGQRCRGLAVYAEDDFAVGMNRSGIIFGLEWYHNAWQCKGCYDCYDGVFDCPIHPGTSIGYSWNWGIGIEYAGDRYIYHANQDVDASIFVYDHSCNEIDRLITGPMAGSSEYPTACDLDANGNVYVAWYINTRVNQIEVYPARGNWVNHVAAPLTGFDAGAYVCEGMCVNAAGTEIWTTNRSAIGSFGWVKRFTGDVVAGFTEDLVFGAPAVPGYVRAVDVDEANNRIFVCSDQNPGDSIFVFNATTGARIETFCVDDATTYGGDTYHNSPYDIEWDAVGKNLYIQHYYGWYVDKWTEKGTPWAVTMSSFEATAGQEMVELTWRVDSEIDNQGFNLFRDDQKIAFVESRGATETARTYTWIDKEVVAGVTYTYRIADVSLEGKERMHDFVATATPLAASGMPTEYWLSQNYPNPFNADTHIEFKLAQAGHTSLKIYNTTGQLIRTLVDRDMAASHHKVRWDGRNEYGEVVASGIYFYRLASGNFAETKKMSFLR